MKKIKLSLLFAIMLFAMDAAAQKKCDCSITPYRPDSCFYPCASQILRNATDIDLALVLGLDEDLTNKILKVNKDSANATFKTYIANLNGQETDKLIRSIKSLNKEQNQYLNKRLEDKKSIMANMEKELKNKPG